ncbi:hypothetical protein [Kaarinaea lacus]
MRCTDFCFKSLCLLIFAFFLVACGGGGDGGDPNPNNTPNTPTPDPDVLTGVFVDSPVSGANYSTETQSGMTNSAGEYNYVAGESVTFSIGGIVLGTATAGPVVTPLMLVDGAVDATDPRVTNIVRFLMTLDSDGNPENGIEITAVAHNAAAGMSLDFSSATFDADSQALFDAVKGTGTQLVDGSSAQDHFNTSLKTSWGTMTWGTDCWGQVCQQTN